MATTSAETSTKSLVRRSLCSRARSASPTEAAAVETATETRGPRIEGEGGAEAEPEEEELLGFAIHPAETKWASTARACAQAKTTISSTMPEPESHSRA